MSENIKLRTINPAGMNGDDNTDGFGSCDRQQAMLVSQLNMPLYNYAARGKLFHGMSVTAGHVVPADNTTTPTYALWNPANSGVNVVPVAFKFGTITLGTRAVSAWAFNIITGLGSAIGTGTACTAFASTPTAIKAADWSTGASKCLFSNTGTVTVSATTDFYTLGVSHDLATTGEHFQGICKFDGDWIVAPGTMIFPVTHAAASGSTYLMQLSWLEIPIL